MTCTTVTGRYQTSQVFTTNYNDALNIQSLPKEIVPVLHRAHQKKKKKIRIFILVTGTRIDNANTLTGVVRIEQNFYTVDNAPGYRRHTISKGIKKKNERL